MTFSISARCARTGMVGTAVSSSSMAVAARCSYVRSGVGAVSTQNITDPTLGDKGLTLMEEGCDAPAALARLIAEQPHMEYRQVVIVDANGGTATHSGAGTLGIYATAEAPGVAAAGNLLDNDQVPHAMIAAFEAAPSADHLGDRLLAAMRAGLAAGGETGPVHSAGMLIADKQAWPMTDLRVDWCDGDPVAALHAIWRDWSPQMNDYVARALDPSAAPSYGVPGDV